MKKIKNKLFMIGLSFVMGFAMTAPVYAQQTQTNDDEPSLIDIQQEAVIERQEQIEADRIERTNQILTEQGVNNAANAEARQDAVLLRQGNIAVDRVLRSDQIRDAQERAYDSYVDRAFERDVVNILNRSLNRAVVDAIQNDNRRYVIDQQNQAYDAQYERNYQRDQERMQIDREYRENLIELQEIRSTQRLVERDQAVEAFNQRLTAQTQARQDAIDERNANNTSTMARYQSQEVQSLGQMIMNFGGNMTRLPSLFYIFSYVSGAFLMAMGLLKANKATMNPQQHPVSNAIKYMFAGVAMTVLPTTVTVLKNSLGIERSTLGIDYTKGLNGGPQQAGEGADALEQAGGTATGLDQFFVLLMRDIGEPLFIVINLFGLVAGVFLIANALQRLTKGAQEGPKGPAGIGTIMNFAVGAALISLVPTLKVFMVSLFGNTQVVAFPNMTAIAGQIGVADASMAQATAVITALLGFLAIIGAISFVRGLFMLKDVSDGAQNASFMGSISHLVAGVLCVNFGAFLNVFQNTLNLTEYGILFTN